MTRYAYVHARPEATDQSAIFYVGKGRGLRANVLPARNRYHGFVLDKYGAENILVGKIECSDDATAFELEIGLIKCLRRSGVQLTNMTDGGDGTSGHVVTEEGRIRRSEQTKARWADPESRKPLEAGIRKANRNSWADPEVKARHAQALKGHRKTMSPEAIEARRLNLIKTRSPEARAKIAETTKARWADPEYKAKVRARLIEVLNKPEKRAAMRAARKSRKNSIQSGEIPSNTSDKES